MLKIIKKLDINYLQDENLLKWLDKKFGTKLVLPTEPKGKKAFNTYLGIMGELSKWGREFNNDFPQEPEKALFYINRKTFHYGKGNLQGRISYNYIWPKFFETFPLGEIWLIDISYNKWFHPMWDGGKKIADKYRVSLREHHVFQPQQGTGFSGENLPMLALSFMVTCVFPILVADFCHTSSGLVFLFIPDRSFNYSLLKREGVFEDMVFDFGIHRTYGDQYSFDKYGAKIEANLSLINPKKLTKFFDWFIRKMNRRMMDIVNIEETEKREQLVMTLNRAIFDAQMSIIYEIPYTAKSYFFGLVDKLANIQAQLNNLKPREEKDYWRKLVSVNFIQDNLKSRAKRLSGVIGKHYLFILEKIINQIEKEGHTEQDFLDMRNSLHGYGIRAWKRMARKDGILNNNVVLLSAPLIFYLISRPFKYK